jgi:hypothetical protein
MLGNLLLWCKIMVMLWNIAHFSKKVLQNQVVAPSQYPHSVTEPIYCPPVCCKKLPLILTKRCYERSNYQRTKQSCSLISWRAKAMMTEYKRITPVWPSNKRPYPTEYSPTALDSAAISTRELLWTHIKSKNKTSNSHWAVPWGNRNGSLPLYPSESQHGWTVLSYPSLVPSLWENDCYQSNRWVCWYRFSTSYCSQDFLLHFEWGVLPVLQFDDWHFNMHVLNTCKAVWWMVMGKF